MPPTTNSQIEQLQREASAKQVELDQKIAAAQERQRQLDRLQTEVDQHADALAVAEATFSATKQRLNELETVMIELWAGAASSFVRTGAPTPVVDYSGIVHCKAAMTDFPRVRAVLAERVQAAQEALDVFTRKNP